MRLGDVAPRALATEGLAPMLVTHVADVLVQIAARGVVILRVEHKLTIALNITSRLYVIGRGRVVFDSSPDDFRRNDGVRKGVAGGLIRRRRRH